MKIQVWKIIMSIKILKLKNEAEVPQPIVLNTLMTLNAFIEEGDGVLLYEIYKKAQYTEYGMSS
jgi:hypothetical protein